MLASRVPTLAVAALCIATAFGQRLGTQHGDHLQNGDGPVQVRMRNIRYHYTDRVAVHIIELQGSLTPLAPAKFPIFDDSRSFALNLDSAQISISTDVLANVLNQYVFAAPDAALKEISLSIDGQKVKIKGKLHSKGDVPFETSGAISPTDDGLIRLHLEK